MQATEVEHIYDGENENSQLINGTNLELRYRNANPWVSPLPRRIKHASSQRNQICESIPSLL